MKGVVTTVRFLLRSTLLGMRDDVRRSIEHARLLVGVSSMSVGLLTFSSGRYCDGTVADHFACTRPSTYYYYSELSIFLVVVGMVLLTLWYLRMREHQ